jgi:preprotein translocase subunit SecE
LLDVAKATSKTEQSFLDRLIQPIARYLRDTRAELRKVTWPSREEAWHLTLIVLGATAGMSIILGASDFIFSRVMGGVVTANLIWIAVGVVVVIGGTAAIYLIERE